MDIKDYEDKTATLLRFTTPDITVRYMQEIAEQASTDPQIVQLARQLSNNSRPEKAVFDYVYKNVAYKLDPVDVQRLRTPMRTLREQKGNCVDYAILISSLLQAMGIPHKMRMVSMSGWDNFDHIYIVTAGQNELVLDPVIGQQQNDKDTLSNRSPGQFNKEVNFINHKDIIIMPRLDVMGSTKKKNKNMGSCGCGCGGSSCRSGSMRGSRRGSAGVMGEDDDKTTVGEFAVEAIKWIGDNVWGEDAKRKCDLKYPFNRDRRRACKCVAAIEIKDVDYSPPSETCDYYLSRQGVTAKARIDEVLIDYFAKPSAQAPAGAGLEIRVTGGQMFIDPGEEITITKGRYAGIHRIIAAPQGKWLFVAARFQDVGVTNSGGVSVEYVLKDGIYVLRGQKSSSDVSNEMQTITGKKETTDIIASLATAASVFAIAKAVI